ncbi:MAG: D-glycero-beta-D-manno-heptose 1-phosphate adenylyltransferase [Fuerstiella sp.]
MRRIEEFSGARLLVIGDVMLDRYVYGDVTRTSPEAPVPVLNVHQTSVYPGGAAGVASFARNLSASVTLCGMVGDDSDGMTLSRLCEEAGLCTEGLLVDDSRVTTRKERFLGHAEGRHAQHVLRVDHETTENISETFVELVLDAVEKQLNTVDAIILSDYAKGVVTSTIAAEIISRSKRNAIPVLIDPGRGRSVDYFSGATLLKPNRTEAEELLGERIVTPQDGVQAAAALRELAAVDSVVITLDKDGCVWADESASLHVSTSCHEVCDITCAGDMFMAALGICTARKFSSRETLQLANYAAGVCVQRVGASDVSIADLKNLLRDQQKSGRSRNRGVVPEHELRAAVSSARDMGQQIVFTNGCFDLLHIGHVSYLQDAAELGDILIVAVNDDARVSRSKGADRPIISAEDRAAMLAALACVDYVIVFSDETPCRLLRELRPDVLVKGGDYTAETVVGSDIVKGYGGTVRLARQVAGMSTTNVIEKLRGDTDGAVATDNH